MLYFIQEVIYLITYLWHFAFTTIVVNFFVYTVYSIHPFNTFFLDKVLMYVGIEPTVDNIILLYTAILVQLFVIVCCLPPMQRISMWLTGARKPKGEKAEYVEKLKKLIEEESNMDLSSVNFYHYNSPDINAFAFGSNHIAIHTPFFGELFTLRETAAIIGHELGHLNLYHTTFSLGTYFLSCLSVFFFNLYTFIANVFIYLLRLLPAGRDLAYLMIFLVHTMFAIFYWVMNLPLHFYSLFASRRNEYAADEYSAKMGFGEDLITAFYKLDGPPAEQSKFKAFCEFFSTLGQTHPPTHKRVKNIKNYLAKQQNSMA